MAYLISLFFIVLLLSPATLANNHTDHLTLLAIKSNIDDPQHVLDSWNTSLHFCQWQGVTCGRRHPRVTKLDLESQGIVGSLSPHIGNLSFLRVIRLANNTFQGVIPPQVGNLFRLQQLILVNNAFEGEVPASLSNCTRLVVLELARNKLFGKLPQQLTSLVNLMIITIDNNGFTGGIPSFLANLTSLEFISAANNHLGGTIPHTLGELHNLQGIGFANCALYEYGLGSEITKEGDIYSFGILLLEMITGKRPTDQMFQEGLNLHGYVKMAVPECFMVVIDPALLRSLEEEMEAANINREAEVEKWKILEDGMISLGRIGLGCSMESPKERMDASKIIYELRRITDILSRVLT